MLCIIQHNGARLSSLPPYPPQIYRRLGRADLASWRSLADIDTFAGILAPL